MLTKKCPACNHIFPFDQDQCPECGLSGQNQLFLSRAAYEMWVKTVLNPHMEKLRPPQVFTGPNHALILLSNGDLYAIGNNRNEACGSHLPQELKTPARIAQNVKHAAASPNHTVYVDRSGEVKLLGSSDLVDRFDCPILAERVYADSTEDAFVILDEQGNTYFFGRNPYYKYLDCSKQVLRKLPKITMRTVKKYGWWEYSDYYGTRRGGCYTDKGEYYLTGSRYLEDIPEVQAARQEGWFHALLQTYGEENINITLDEPIETRVTEERKTTNYNGTTETETYYTKIYQPKVILKNWNIYQPVPYSAIEEIDSPLCYRCCWPLDSVTWCQKEYLKNASKVMIGSSEALHIHYDTLGYLDKSEDFHIIKDGIIPYYRDDIFAEHKIPIISEIVDFAINSEDDQNDYDYILLVTKDREVFLGSKQKLAETGNWDHLQKLSFR